MRTLTTLARLLPLGGILLAVTNASASEHVTLQNGFDLVCHHREVVGDRVRLFTSPESFVEVGALEITSIEWMPVSNEVELAAQSAQAALVPRVAQLSAEPQLSKEEVHELMAKAGLKHNLDVNLLASVVRAESGGNVHAVSRTGARGLMQLMPGTASELGVTDSFHAEQNINGGTAYLDRLLTKYHDNLSLALAAYNAGPAAVERYRGIPPYRETRAYVARVIREFNRLCTMRNAESDSALRQHLRGLGKPGDESASNAVAAAVQLPPVEAGGIAGTTGAPATGGSQ